MQRTCRESKDYAIGREITIVLKTAVDNAILKSCDSCDFFASPFKWCSVYSNQWIIQDCFGMCTALAKNPFFLHKLISEHT